MKFRHATLVLASLLWLPGLCLAQESDPPLAKGDSVQFAIEEDNWSGSWVGIVHEVKNTRNCFFVVHSKILTGSMFSFGVRFSDEFTVQRFRPDGEVEAVSGATLREYGIDCVETHPTPDRPYLLPESDSKDEESRGA